MRLNKKMYHEQDFKSAGIRHVEHFYLDGSCPPLSILQAVLEDFESVPEDKAFAIHCKAGLGRTGTCVGCYLMKHYQFTAAQAIAWMRICRPGSVIGPQQHFLKQMETRMWRGGAELRKQKRLSSSRQLKHAAIESTATTESMEEDCNNNGGPVLAEDEEALTGRAGQAAALLSARSRRSNTSSGTPEKEEGVNTKVESKQHRISTTTPPITPECTSPRGKPALVTPDKSDKKTRGWFT